LDFTAPSPQNASSGAFTFGAQLTRYFDIVGMDPRGVGRSTPLECGDTQQTDAFVGMDPDPDTPQEVAQVDQLNRSFVHQVIHNGKNEIVDIVT